MYTTKRDNQGFGQHLEANNQAKGIRAEIDFSKMNAQNQLRITQTKLKNAKRNTIDIGKKVRGMSFKPDEESE